MAEQIVVVGVGGFGRETLDVIEAINAVAESPVWEILGAVDDSPSDLNLKRLEARGIPFIGNVAGVPAAATVAIGIGSPKVRHMIHGQLAERGFAFASLIHPTAVVGSQVRIGDGAIICAGVSIGTNVALGKQIHLNPHSVIGHDTVLGDFVSVNPNATVSGECTLNAEVLLGAGALILQGLKVGARATIGAAACVTKDVQTASTVVGVPAVPLQLRSNNGDGAAP